VILLFLFVKSDLPGSISAMVRENIYDTSSMEEAVRTAKKLSQNGDTVLLSPCCASFDLFDNYEDRGRKFKTEVFK